MKGDENAKTRTKGGALSSSSRSGHRALNGLDRLLGLLLAFTGLLLVLGWTLPVMTVETFFIFEDRITIAGALRTLVEEGEIALFAIVLLFTVIFPVTKISLAYLAWRFLHQPDHLLHRTVAWIEHFGKWSMLDVFVVALFVVVLKLSLLSDVVVEIGLYVFAAAVIGSMITVRRIVILARHELDAVS